MVGKIFDGRKNHSAAGRRCTHPHTHTHVRARVGVWVLLGYRQLGLGLVYLYIICRSLNCLKLRILAGAW